MLGNKIVILLLSTILMTSGLVYGNDNKISDFKLKNSDECIICENDFTFEDELEYLKDIEVSITDKEKEKLKILFSKAVELDGKGDFEKALVIWEEYDKLFVNITGLDDMECYEYEDFEYTFESELEYLKELDVNLSESNINDLRLLFDGALELENNEEFEKAMDAWTEYDKLLGQLTDFYDYSDNLEYTFEDELEYLKELGININDSDIAKLKELFNKTLENEESDQIWDEYYNFFDELAGENFDYSFEEELEYLKEMDINPTLNQIEQLEKLFNIYLELEKNGDNELADKAYEKYEDLLNDMFGELIGEYEENIDIHGVYDITDNKLILSLDKNDYPDNHISVEITDEMKKLHQKLWDRVSEIIPNSYKKYIGKFEIGTDGIDGILASVVELNDLSNWSLFVDIKDSLNDKNEFLKDFETTIIHEFGHILTLNNTQLTKRKINNTYETEEGSTRVNSYLNKFYDKFWKNIDANEDEYDRYDENNSSYVTEYAASNVEEDIAESFATFILGDKKRGRTIAEEKINFFYNFDELIKLRNTIRENLGLK